MKGLFFLVTCIFLAFNPASASTHPDKAFSHVSMEEVYTQAWREGQMIVVDFTADWCLPCQMMEQYTFSNSEVIGLLRENFVAVQYDIQSYEGMTLRNEYAIKSLPTVIVLHPDGTELKRMQGSMGASELISELRSVLSTHRIEKKAHYGLERPPLKPLEKKGEEDLLPDRVLQFGLFSSRENAEELQRLLPVSSLIIEQERNDRQMWAVISGDSHADVELQKLKEELMTKGFASFIRQGPG